MRLRALVCGLLCLYVPKFEPPRGPHLLVLAGLSGFLDTALGFVLLAGDALGINPQQNVHAVSCPLGDLGCWYSSVEPCGQRRVAQVIGPPGQQ